MSETLYIFNKHISKVCFIPDQYNLVVIIVESQYRESDFYDLGWERLSLTILMSQYV